MSSTAAPRLDDAPDELSARVDRRELAIVGGVALLLAASYIAIAAAHGALGAARADDWAYYTVASRFAQHGRVQLDGWPSMMLVGQLVLAWPIIKIFGDHIASLQLMVAVLGAVGLTAAYLLVRTFLSRGWSAFCIACLALGPVYGTLSVSFMTDVPSFALQMLTLLVGARALRARRPSMGWFAGALAVGVCAFSVREYAVAAGAAVTLVVAWRAWTLDRRLLGRVAAIVAGWLVVLAALYLWRSRLPHSLHFVSEHSLSSLHHAFDALTHAALTLGLFVAPALLTISPTRLVRAAWERARVAGGVAVALTVLAVAIARFEFVGNYFTRLGSYTVVASGTPPPVVPRPAWDVLGLIGFAGLVGLVLVAVVAAADWRRGAVATPLTERDDARLLLGVFVLLTALIIVVVVCTTNSPYYDRYLITVVPFIAAFVVLAGREHELAADRATAGAAVGLVAIGLLGLAWVDASAAFDGGRWRVAQAVADKGYDPAKIDGGLEWFGYHQSDDVAPRDDIKGVPFWITLFSPRPVCATVTLPGTDPAAKLGDQVLAQRTARTLFGLDYRFTARAGPQHCAPER